MKIRPTRSDDIPDLKLVLDGTQLFPGDMLPDMVGGFLSDVGSEDIWLTCEVDSRAVGFCYAVREQLAEGTWNMLAIAISPSGQRSGLGRSLVKALETMLRERGHRILIAETSGTGAFEQARAFYSRNGYVEEARIRDFWAEGDDKIIFWKSL